MNPDSSEAHAAAARLEHERQRIKAQVAAVVADYQAGGPITTSDDAAADTTEAGAHLELQRDLDAQLADVDAALQRIASGTYGIDEVTGEPIDPARLEAFPTARTNI